MPYDIMFTKDAEADLAIIYDYIAVNDCNENANHLLNQLLLTAENLAKFPDKGCYPKELQELGIYDYRQTLFKSYRLIYQILANQVIILIIIDGRRDMQTLLTRRLLAK